MKVKLSVLIAMMMFLGSNIIAQNISLTFGTSSQPSIKETGEWSCLVQNSNSHFVNKIAGMYGEIKDNVYLPDGSFEKAYIPKISVGSFSNSYSLEDVFQFGGKLFAAVDHFSKSDTKHSFSIRAVDDNSGVVSETDVELMSIVAEKMGNKGNYNFAVSPNQSIISVIGDLPFVKGQPCKLRVAIYDNTMAKKGEQEVVLPGENSRYNSFQTYVNNDGVVFVIRSGFAKNGDTQLDVFQIDAKAGAELKEYFVSLEVPTRILSYVTDINPLGELVIAGTTTQRKVVSFGETKASGVFYFFTSKLSEGITNYSPFDAPIDNLISRKLVFNGDTYFLITEQFKEERKSQNSGSGTISLGYDYTYTSNGNNVFGFAADGSKKFNIELNRQLSGYNAKQHMQIGVYVINNKLTLLYNDDYKKYENSYHYDSKLIPVVTQITNDGLMQTPVPFIGKLNIVRKHMVYPGLGVKQNGNQIHVLTQNLSSAKTELLLIKVE